MTFRAGPAVALVVAAVALTACTLDLAVNVEVAPDGSGAVEVIATLDADALARAGGDLGDVLALDDLRARGWTVDGPVAVDGGGATVRLHQPFADAAAAEAVFEDLAGPDGPFRGFRVTRRQGLLSTRWGFEGTVDLRRAADVPFVELPPADGEDAPADAVGDLDDQLGRSLDRLLRLRVGVRLPGDVDSNATTRAANGAVWQVRFGDGPLEMEATGRRTRTGVLALVVGSGAVVVVGGVAVLIRLAGRTTGAAPPGPATRSGRGGP